jgi:hypothetical protein
VKKSTLWIIRVALSVQFLAVLAVPAIIFADEIASALQLHSINR